MTCRDFFELLSHEFPELQHELQDKTIAGLCHLEMSRFANATQKAIDSSNFELLKKYFKIADRFFRIADPELKNAFYVSYLEHLHFEGISKAGMSREAAKKLLPSSLVSGLKEVNNYLDNLFCK